MIVWILLQLPPIALSCASHTQPKKYGRKRDKLVPVANANARHRSDTTALAFPSQTGHSHLGVNAALANLTEVHVIQRWPTYYWGKCRIVKSHGQAPQKQHITILEVPHRICAPKRTKWTRKIKLICGLAWDKGYVQTHSQIVHLTRGITQVSSTLTLGTPLTL